jgi:hypothetical protein
VFLFVHKSNTVFFADVYLYLMPKKTTTMTKKQSGSKFRLLALHGYIYDPFC